MYLFRVTQPKTALKEREGVGGVERERELRNFSFSLLILYSDFAISHAFVSGVFWVCFLKSTIGYSALFLLLLLLNFDLAISHHHRSPSFVSVFEQTSDYYHVN